MKGDRGYRYETFAEAGYMHISYDPHTGQHTLKELETGNLEAWSAAGRYFNGYGLIYKNTILEFCSTIRKGAKS